MRTTEDLIKELNDRAEGAWVAGIVVGFEWKTETVWANTDDPLRDLNAFVQSGGEPMAICRVDKTEDTFMYSVRALEEFADQSWGDVYLDELCSCFAKEFAEEARANGWALKRVRPHLP